MTSVLWMIGVAAALVVGWWIGRRGAPEDRSPEVLRALAEELSAGRIPAVGSGSPEGLDDVCRALDREWASKNAEREQALREALGRIASFLREGVRDPLRDSLSMGAPAQREAIETAVGAVQDLEFFLRDPLTPDETHNLIPVVQQVTREFIQDWEIAVRFQAQAEPVRAHIHRGTFMDAVYLLLHNAGQFGEEQTVDVTVREEDGNAVVVIRDRGPGFSPEALERAHDLFFTTTETGLGLGIPFARKIVEGLGGSIELSNVPEGGAQVRMILPSA
jgi:signal transduction histidine kinase